MSDIVIHWHCTCYVGEPIWQGDDYEPRDCDTEFTTEGDSENWSEHDCSATCPSCHAELTQRFDKPTCTKAPHA